MRSAASYIAPGMFDVDAPRAWPFGDLVPGAYDLIMADPPWRFELRSAAGEEKSPQAHYATMSLDEIARLPVADLAAPDCMLWLWGTAPMLRDQYDIAAAWGFTPKSSGVWVKTTRNGKIGFGTGYILRNAHEPFIIATRGAPVTTRTVRSVVMGELREHSRKPDAAYRAAEQLMPHARRASLFERPIRPGWDGWGHEYGLPIEPRKIFRGAADSRSRKGSTDPGALLDGAADDEAPQML